MFLYSQTIGIKKILGFLAGGRGGNLTRTWTQFLRWSPVSKGEVGLPPKTLFEGIFIRRFPINRQEDGDVEKRVEE